MSCTIEIIARAVRLRGGSSSHFGFDVPAPVWQLPQHRLNDVVNTPIVPMNSSTGMPLSTWMFLNTVSDICGLAGVAAAVWIWPSAALNAMLVSPATASTVTEKISPLDNNFMNDPSNDTAFVRHVAP